MQTSSVILGAKPLPLWSPIVILKSLYTPKTTTTTFSFNDSYSGGVSMAAAPPATATAPKWAQKTITLPPHKRGCHLITPKILKEIGQDLSGFKCGLAHLFLQHTSASLTINENYDSDVRDDTETFLNRVVPEGSAAPWKHTLEGPDDMPAHIKSSMFGCTLTIPITNGQLNMGTWQCFEKHALAFANTKSKARRSLNTSRGLRQTEAPEGIWLCEHRDHPTARRVVVTLNGI
ncbi:hypothetical protein RHSIM_Rhsim06G0000500 [Rhododendron simsii]|uniref:Uncharacterized protein n=1 Tax=Rhododendron simsii TaxID=118357 RepID=A0A834H3S3_RHOSS|nr:hypothetical protein RHSIM_Rhsim06G0000500 [Rhododendron simsii]